MKVMLTAERITELLKLCGDQTQQVTGLLTEHCHLRGHLFKLGEVNNAICNWYYPKTETASRPF